MRPWFVIAPLLGSLVLANAVAMAHEGEPHHSEGWSFGRPGLAKDVMRTGPIEDDEHSFSPVTVTAQVVETVNGMSRGLF